jgi:hypothetical protein
MDELRRALNDYHILLRKQPPLIQERYSIRKPKSYLPNKRKKHVKKKKLTLPQAETMKQWSQARRKRVLKTAMTLTWRNQQQ